MNMGGITVDRDRLISLQKKHVELVEAAEKYKELMDNPDIQIDCEAGDNCVLCVAWDNLKAALGRVKG